MADELFDQGAEQDRPRHQLAKDDQDPECDKEADEKTRSGGLRTTGSKTRGNRGYQGPYRYHCVFHGAPLSLMFRFFALPYSNASAMPSAEIFHLSR